VRQTVEDAVDHHVERHLGLADQAHALRQVFTYVTRKRVDRPLHAQHRRQAQLHRNVAGGRHLKIGPAVKATLLREHIVSARPHAVSHATRSHVLSVDIGGVRAAVDIGSGGVCSHI